MQKLKSQRSGFDLIQKDHQKLSVTSTEERISRFGIGVSTVLPERCQTCRIIDVVRIVQMFFGKKRIVPRTDVGSGTSRVNWLSLGGDLGK